MTSLKRYLPIIFLAAHAWAQTASISSVNSTSAILQIRGATGACTLALSESSALSPLHPDVKGAEYSGAGTDTGRSDTITWADGTRVVRLGHNTDDRALAAATAYYGQISGCGVTTAFHFSTSTISNVTQPAVPPFNSANWGNLGMPLRNGANWLVDPLSGVKLRPVNLPGDWTYRTGAIAFLDYAGAASGWSNASTIFSGQSSTATTSSATAIDLLIPPYWRTDAGSMFFPYTDGASIDDVGIVLWGSGTGTSPAISVCLVEQETASCIGTPFTVPLTSTFGPVRSGSGDPDGAWPTSFPSFGRTGWGLTTSITHNKWPQLVGQLTVTAGAWTITKSPYVPDVSPQMAVGNKVFVAGSSPACANNLCTIATVTNALTGTFAESLTTSGAVAARFYPLAIRIVKASGTSITVGAQYKLAGNRTFPQSGAGEAQCGQPFTSGDGHMGRLCVLIGGPQVYFVSADGTVRPIWGNQVPALSYFQNAGFADGDIPLPGVKASISSFDASDGKTLYTWETRKNGGSALYKLVYTGDATASGGISDYTMSYPGDSRVVNGPSDYFTWYCLTPSGHDFNSDLTGFGYNSTLYGPWSSFSFRGISGTTAYFLNLYGGQNLTPAWVAVVDLTLNPPAISNLIHTADGTGTNGIIQYGANHTIQPLVYPDTALITNDPLVSSNSSYVHGGPFEATLTGVLRGGAWSTNTALPWPPDSSYDNQCPSGNPFESEGAVGNQCVTLRFPRGGVCNIAPRTDEKALWPCPWNSGYSQPFSLKPGSYFVNLGNYGDGNIPGYRVISTSVEGDGQLRVVAQRNAQWGYCCIDRTHLYNGVSYCVCVASQATEKNGWTAMMEPAHIHGCAAAAFYVHGKTQMGQLVAEPGAAHSELSPGITPGNVSYISNTSGTIDVPFGSALSFPNSNTKNWVNPTWAGTTLPVGGGAVQTYVATPGAVPWMLDFNALNGNYGSYLEGIASIGSRTLTATATPNVYQIQVLGTLDYKHFPLYGFAGPYVLREISGPSSDVTASPYTFCYALNAGECYTGSPVGNVYVNVPFAYDPGYCASGQHWANIPCVMSGYPGGGWIRQQRIVSDDPTSTGTHLLTSLLAHPGSHAQYSAIAPVSAEIGIASATLVEGWGSAAWLVKLPPWQEDAVARNNFTGPVVQVAAAPHARVRFGKTPSFYCTGRAEACVTDASGTQPYKFASESQVPLNCSSGCSIKVPCVAGQTCYYRWEQLDSAGNVLVAGDTQAEAIH